MGRFHISALPVFSDISRLTEMFRRFFLVNLCFTAFTQINNSFINTFVQRTSGGSRQVMLYNIVLALVQPLFMVWAVRLARRTSPVRVQQWGIGLFGVVYLVLIVFMEQVVALIWLVGALLSAATGFYFTTYILQLLHYTDDRDRDVAFGVMGAVGGLVTLVMPLLSGLLISLFPDNTGYRLLFFAGLAITVLCLALSRRLYPIPPEAMEGGRGNGAILCVLLRDAGMRSALCATWITGVYAGTMVFFLNTLLYALVHSEALIGLGGFLSGAMSIFASLLYIRVVRPNERVRAMLLSVLCLLAVTALLYLRLSPLIIIAYQLCIALASPFFSNPPVILYMGALQSRAELAGHSAQVHALREFFYSAGRISGIVLAMVLPKTNTGAVTVLATLVGTQLLLVALCRSVRKDVTAQRDGKHKVNSTRERFGGSSGKKGRAPKLP